MAPANHNLAELLLGRRISGTGQSSSGLIMSFTDGSKLTVKTAPSNTNRAATGASVEKVRQSVDPPSLCLDLDDGTTFGVDLANATSSITLRDKGGVQEYAD